MSPGQAKVSGSQRVSRWRGVVDFTDVVVEGRLSASDIAFIEENQPARVSSYSYSGKVFEGKVSNVSPTVDPETRTFLVEVALQNPEGLLRPGLFVKVDLVVERKEDVVVVPKDAVVLRKNRPVVFVRRASGCPRAARHARSRWRRYGRNRRGARSGTEVRYGRTADSE